MDISKIQERAGEIADELECESRLGLAYAMFEYLVDLGKSGEQWTEFLEEALNETITHNDVFPSTH